MIERVVADVGEQSKPVPAAIRFVGRLDRARSISSPAESP